MQPKTKSKINSGSSEEIKSYYNFASYHVGLSHDKVVYEVNGRTFNPVQYSDFKHGRISSANSLAQVLANDLMIHFNDFFEGYEYDELVIAPFPFKELTTAAGQLVAHLLDYLNMTLAYKNHNPATLYQIYKFTGKASNEHFYPNLKVEGRKAILDQCQYTFDIDRLAKIKKIVIVDDVFVTGTSAQKVSKSLLDAGFKGEVIFVYVAKIEEDTATKSPEIEYLLNHTSIQKPAQLIPLIQNNDFEWNIRCLKFVLEAPISDFLEFVEKANKKTLFDMNSLALRMNYRHEPKYQQNLDILTLRSIQYGLECFN
ncbi:MAG: phosphoribosyltransferase family protein [Patescibacteria group bacterium]